MIKKLLSLFIIFSFILIMPVSASEITESELVPGITKKIVTSYVSAGRQEATILEIDLDNPRLKVQLLTDAKGASYLSNVKNMAQSDERVVAAINGDFFARYYQDSTRGSAVGLNVTEGELITSAPTDEELASFVFTTEGAILSQYFKPSMTVTNSNGVTEEIETLNKFSSLAKLALYNSFWGETFYCNGGSEQVAVIEDNKVTEIITEPGDILIPEDGYLLAGLSDFTEFISNLTPGEKVELDISFTPYFGDIETAIGGGTVLVKNGEKAPITHMRYGRDFRSALGVSRDNKTLYFITVDKNSKSIGMTLDELASLMLELDIFDGINLDGGGSTQLIARETGDAGVSTINSPENGYLRPVANALAITLSGGERGKELGITVKTNYDTLTVKETLTVSCILYDELYYPLPLDETKEVLYRFTGVTGTQSGNTFTPSEPGQLKITASYDGYTTYKTVTVTDPDIYMDCDAVIYKVSSGETLPVVVNAITLGGKRHTVSLNDLQVVVPSNLKYENGVITAVSSGFGEIKFYKDDFSFSAYVSVDGVLPESEFTPPAYHYEDFETPTASALSYPAETFSEYNITSSKSTEGMLSGKLKFDFDNDITALQSSYVVFDNPITYTRSDTTLKIDVYSGGYDDVSLKTMVTDSLGEVHRINIGDLSERGWTTHKIALPENISLPAKISRIYVVEDTAGTKESGSLYFDNMVVTEGDLGDYDTDTLKTDFILNPSLVITGGVSETDTLLDTISAIKIKNELSKAETSYSFESSSASNNQISSDIYKTDDITVIKYTNISALKENIDDSSKNVIIIADNLANKQEIISLLKECSRKTFFVVTRGDKPSTETDKNIRIITLPATAPSIILNQKNYVTLSFGKVSGKLKYTLNYVPLW